MKFGSDLEIEDVKTEGRSFRIDETGCTLNERERTLHCGVTFKGDEQFPGKFTFDIPLKNLQKHWG